jgi:hypothetical protein
MLYATVDSGGYARWGETLIAVRDAVESENRFRRKDAGCRLRDMCSRHAGRALIPEIFGFEKLMSTSGEGRLPR